MTFILNHLLLVTFALIVIAIAIAIGVYQHFHRVYPDQTTRPAVASAIVGIVVTVLFSVLLNNLFASKRDRDSRLWTLTQRHIERLSPLLVADSKTFVSIADQLRRRGFFMDLTGKPDQIQAGQKSTWWPDVMSEHLAVHFPDYYKSREALRAELNAHDEEFRKSLLLVEDRITSYDPRGTWKRWISLSVLEKCLGKGPGMTLTVTGTNFSYTTPGGGSGSGSGHQPPRELISGVRAFQAFEPSTELISACERLRQRSDYLESKLRELAQSSLVLAEQTNLHGPCSFVALD